MNDPLFFLLFFISLGILGVIAKSSRRRKFKYNVNEEWPFEKKKLMTAPEQLVYSRLIESLPELCIFSQVQLSQLVSVKKAMILSNGLIALAE